MNDYISKQRAKDLMGCCLASAKANYKAETSVFKKEQFKRYAETIEAMIDVVGAVEASDVQPVKHGYWEEVTDYGGWGDTHYRCSVCGEEWYLEDGKPKDNNMNFCPRCGARMDGEQNEVL